MTISYTDVLSDEQITLDIWAPEPAASGRSYVRYNGDKQLCRGLSSRGDTLTYYAGTPLVDLVRREYRAMRAAERREAARGFQ